MALAVGGAILAATQCQAGEAIPQADAALLKSASRPLAVRVQWGGGQPAAWSGRVALVASDGQVVPELLRWRTLCLEHDAAATVHSEGTTILVHQPRPIALDGIEIEVADPRGLRLVVELAAAKGAAATRIELPLCDLLGEPVQRPLDSEGNRVTARVPAGESLRVRVDPPGAAAGPQGHLPHPGQRLRITVDPLLPVKPDGTAVVELRMRLCAATRSGDLAVRSTGLVPIPGLAVDGAAAERWARFEPVAFDVALPAEEGVYEVVLEAVERGGLRWMRTVGSRTVQVVAVDRAAPAESSPEWRVIHEVDPGSPKLHERLRRLPGVGLSDMSLPSLSMPAMPLPRFTRPGVALPLLPGVSSLPATIPAVSSLTALVPRLGGLLAAGHSRVEPHTLGALLRLPAAAADDAAPWEGILVANTEPGLPHAVEIEYPTDQDAILGVSVLETDAAGAFVLQQHAGGFEVRRARWSSEPARLAVHRFVFWPTTRHPLLVIANPSRDAAALFGRVRISVCTGRLPAGPAPGSAGGSGRGLHAFLPQPDLTGLGGSRGAAPASDWHTHLAATRHASDLLRAHAADGALVTVFSKGAALWPSRHTREAARWDTGRAGEAGVDHGERDLLALLCRVFGRAGQRLVPGLSFDSPLPELETILARGAAEADGIACVGGSGRAARLEGGATHYNILDPRVQDCVAAIVAELAERVASARTVDGVALVLPHDGWLHLPGIDWALDDATIARFVRDTYGLRGPLPPEVAALVEAEPAGQPRFSARAAAVLGPLRREWLAWRAAEIARFHGRLAEIVAATTGGGSTSATNQALEAPRLWIVPTTLLLADAPAGRLRPTLLPADERGPLLEAGIDPRLITADPRIVFVGPQVHGSLGLTDRGTVAAANREAAAAMAAAGRRGMVIVERRRPLPVADVVPHGPFGTASPTAGWSMHAVATGEFRDAALADGLALADAERIFDMGLAFELPLTPGESRIGLAGLPARPLEPLRDLPAPLAVRTLADDHATWVQLVNPTAAAARFELDIEAGASGGLPRRSNSGDRSAHPQPPQPTVPRGWDLGPGGIRVISLEPGESVAAARVEFAAGVIEAVAARVGRLRRLRGALDAPVPVAVLDNPGFELGGGSGATPATVMPGWELVEPRRGAVGVVPGIAAHGGRALAFSSVHGLSTLESNPFPKPASGRIGVAAWLRVREGEPQPPLRLALEGTRGASEYYRFAPVGGLAGGRPLGPQWAQFVLQVDDLPDEGLDSLRVRFDLLGPGSVEIDEVRVYDLAFDQRQRDELSRLIGGVEQRLAAEDLAGCLLELEGHWPRYLEAFVPDPEVSRAAAVPPPRGRPGVMDRVRRLWQ